MRYLLSIGLLLARPTLAQTPDSSQTDTLPGIKLYRYSIYVEINQAYNPGINSLTNFNNALAANQINQSSQLGAQTNYTLGLNLALRIKRTKIGLKSLIGLPYNQAQGMTFANQTAFGGVDVGGGYDVLNTRNYRLFLNAGVGVLTQRFVIYQRTNQPVPYSQLFQPNTLSGATPPFGITNAVWDINAELMQREKHPYAQQRLLFRIGYRRGIVSTAWRSDGYPLVNSPLDRISQLYVSFGLLFSQNRDTLRRR